MANGSGIHANASDCNLLRCSQWLRRDDSSDIYDASEKIARHVLVFGGWVGGHYWCSGVGRDGSVVTSNANIAIRALPNAPDAASGT